MMDIVRHKPAYGSLYRSPVDVLSVDSMPFRFV